MIIRTARPEDIEQLLKLSALLPPGMTSMPADRETWEKKLELVHDSLHGPARLDRESVYLLVMEDMDTNAIVGTAGIVTGVGLTRPFYNYKLSKDVKASEALGIRVISNVLNLVNDFTGETELVSLFLMPGSRKNRGGQFLSRCRFLFMSDFPERFSETVFAEIRGWLDEEHNSPFWQHLGQKFFNLPFARADFISAVNGSQFISDLMPRFPVYQELLPPEAVAVIGRPHDESVPAKKILEKEGFSYQGTIDIFDAGPVMQCERSHIASIAQTSSAVVAQIVPQVAEGEHAQLNIISNSRLEDYKLAMSDIEVASPASDEPAQVTLAQQVADNLGLSVGSPIRILALG
ncbi:MAG: arginine N-succinyltransferase subunit beta [Pseudohongiella sp.]|nr:MAG: arginine N-succinyltransferase subunit beta [Pseudohongiella sp.]